MDYNRAISCAGYDSNLLGAIFMSNCETKTECLRRKVFGLPVQMTHFIKKVKAGMLLFLFEYEERKLYGVFEATSDGALNIMPDAFASSGRLFPAQILFKRVWMCKPLSEDEFYVAIKENYYSPYKFHFHLSYEQVFKLLQLFSSKKIGLHLCERPVIQNRLLKQFEKFEKSGLVKFRRTERGRNHPSLAEEHSSGTRASLESQAIWTRCMTHQSNPDPASVSLLPTNCTCSMNVSTKIQTQQGLSPLIKEPSKFSLLFPDLETKAGLEYNESISFSDRYDASERAISLLTPVTTETDGTDSLHDACCNLDASNLKDGSRGDLELDSSLDFIPLPKDEEFAEDMESSPSLTSSQKHPLYKKNSSELEVNDDVYDWCAATSRFHSNSNRERVSVFSRLSKAPEVPQPAKDRDLSLEQLMELLSQRRNQWSNMTKVAKRSFPQDEKKQMEKLAKIEPSGPLVELESRRKLFCMTEEKTTSLQF